MSHALRVLTFNICHTACLATNSDGLYTVAKIIAVSKCDVCVIQEADGSQCPTCASHGVPYANKAEVMVQLLNLLGLSLEWQRGYVSQVACILSKLPIIEERALLHQTRSHGSVVLALNDKRIRVYNVHLDWQQQPQLLLKANNGIKTRKMIIGEWAARGRELEAILQDTATSTIVNATILAGDFNTMSHLDEAGCALELQWPLTLELEKRGYRDAYREVFYDYKKAPGHTWYVPLPNYNMNKEVHGRLDYIFIRSNSLDSIKAINAQVLCSAVHTEWPSDHRALTVDMLI